MFIDYWNYSDCLCCEDRQLIEQALTQILEKEGFRPITKPSLSISSEELDSCSWKLLRYLKDFWIVGLFVGAPGWTIVKTAPNELLCRRAQGASRPRLSELAIRLGCDAFHWGVYDDYYAILLEADRAGYTFVSGKVPNDDVQFYDEPINKPENAKFCLLNLPESIIEVIKWPSLEEHQKKEKKIKALERLEKQGVNLQMEIAALLEGDAKKIDKALGALIGGSPSYWHIYKNTLCYLAYAKQQQLEADDVKLLYFQPTDYYRQLDLLSEIVARY